MAQPARKGPGPFAGPQKDLPAPLKGTDGRCRGLAPPPLPQPDLPSHLAQLNEDPVTETPEVRGCLWLSKSLGTEGGGQDLGGWGAAYRASHTAGA